MIWHLNHQIHGRKPWAVQIEAMRRSDGRDRYGYFMEQGLGKTPQILNDWVEYESRGKVDCVIVLVPNSFKLDWVYAPAEWGIEGLHVRASPHVVQNHRGPFLWAVNYESARSSLQADILQVLKTRRVLLVLDETTAIKNPFTKTAQAVLEMAKRATMVREANGTPLVQTVMDYFAPLKCLSELDGTNPYAFRNRYAIMGGYMGKQIVGMQQQDELLALLGRVSFRALKKDWRKDLPEKLAVTVRLEMTDRQRRHYKEMVEEFSTQINGVDITADLVLTQMDKLRQISSCLALQDRTAEFFVPASRNPKIRATIDILQGGPGKGIVIHYYRASGLELIEALQAEGMQPAWIRGQMQPSEVLEQKLRFNTDSSCRVLVGQVAATAMGHTLTGMPGNDRTNKMVFFENSFSLRDRLQVEDRIHRGEADQNCSYYDLITSPMDQIAVNIITGKRSMADSMDEILRTLQGERRR